MTVAVVAIGIAAEPLDDPEPAVRQPMQEQVQAIRG